MAVVKLNMDKGILFIRNLKLSKEPLCIEHTIHSVNGDQVEITTRIRLKINKEGHGIR